jgi:hypothetical protein
MVSIFFIALAGICNSIMDTIQFKFIESIFSKYPKLRQWSNPTFSWKNKWKNGDPKQGERFLGSSTMFVWVTDLWHFSQSLMITFFCLAAICYKPCFYTSNYIINLFLQLIILKTTFSLCFEIFWSKILKR